MPAADDQPRGARQHQFLTVVSRDEAASRFQAHLNLEPLGDETVLLTAARGRVLAGDVSSPIDVTSFDRANVDGFAVRADDTFGATEVSPCRLQLNNQAITPGRPPSHDVKPGLASPIATGAMVPRGADAVVMIEHTDVVGHQAQSRLEIRHAAAPGQHISHAGTDIAIGETVLHQGQVLSAREIGVLAALGLSRVSVWRRPRVAIISTGDEIVAPGNPLETGCVYDSNAAILGATVEELGCEAVHFGIAPDDETALARLVDDALECDCVLLSGGTSKGAGDISYRVVRALGDPGIVAHGVALKPGKPICLAVTRSKPVVILPGFPTSAIFTFHEFVAPVLRTFSGLPAQRRRDVQARLPIRINSERGRTEYALVRLVNGDDGTAAYPMGKGSGSVTSFSCADGFLTIDQQTEIIDAGASVTVTLLSESLGPADLVVIGSHCVGLDIILADVVRRGFTTSVLHVGSMGGLTAVRRSECDVAGIHLLDAKTGVYNKPFLPADAELVNGYRRVQGLVFRSDDPRFLNAVDVHEVIKAATGDPECRMVNRNVGSGTRILIDQVLGGQRPPGYAVQPKAHNAVVAAVAQSRADWGMAIESVAREYGVSFQPVQDEQYDFAVPTSRLERPAVIAFREALTSASVIRQLQQQGFRT